ncbi:MAG TPA: NYN domain-containing protein [Candidatus Omnitrophota bacterium]|nr:NYN domain-containing protein [Candidatus Omnitrophota bacterium]
MAPLNNKEHLCGKVAVFIDAANIIHCYEDTGWKIDLKKLKVYFENKCTLIGIYYYSAFFEESTTQKSFFEMLSRKGYILRVKKIRKITNDDGTITLKGNCDTDIVVDAVSIMKNYDTAVIMSGDSDFISLVNLLKGQKKKVVIISFRGHVAKDLIAAANYYVDIGKFKTYWELLPKKAP